MIEGVKIKKLQVHPDSRGDFREVLRLDDGLLKRIKQVSISRTLSGVIKAFHWHKNQDDAFYVIQGNIQLVLYDPRKRSSTKGQTQEIFLGESYDPQVVFIPRMVLHGYQPVGEKEVSVLYLMDRTYNRESPDEYRVPYDDSRIGFDWSKKRD